MAVRRDSWVGWALAIVWMIGLPCSARASESLRAGIAAAHEAEFERALGALERAESETLARDELVTLYEQRALVRFALGDARGAERDLTLLAALEPNRVLDGRAPPRLRAVFEQARASLGGRVSLDVAVARTEGSARVHATLIRAPAGLVREVVISYRLGASGAWQSARGDEVVIDAPDAAEISLFVIARGAGGAVIAEDGSERAPRRVVGTVSPEIARSEPDEAPSDDTWLHWGIGLGAGGAVALAVALGVGIAASQSTSDQTAFTGPTLRP
ncbi:hypothetical protein [Sandaracinus amylolyticus]|uniref:hypothetical protein n=1 Tax=Sandaracinus amylolyticus TaxID=927083 RepID=UPI001F3CDE2F|nr:hypothetical protein [Sandaracinus amylolyticus]UJR78730.1 Hypothetical protein I5071_7610 [Sandaracinus amylolyticus]